MIETMGIDLPVTGIFAALVFGYVLGSVPYGLLLTRMAGLGDVRAIGSGNIGATNVLRTGRKGLAAATLVLDMLKGTLAVWIATRFGVTAAILAGLGAFLGHLYPVWLGFKGGKGVATYLGVLLGISWKLALLFAAIWIVMAVLFRYSSLSALTAATVTLLAIYLQFSGLTVLVFAAMTLILIYKHKANIERLRNGMESRIGAKE